MRSEEITFKKKFAIILNKILIVILTIICIPFILIFDGSNSFFRFLADFSQKCSDILINNIAAFIIQ